MRSALLFLSLGLILCFGNAPREIVGGAIRPRSDYRGSTEEYNIVGNNVDNMIDNFHAYEWPEVQPLKLRFESSHPKGYFSLKRCKLGHRPDAKGRCRPVLL